MFSEAHPQLHLSNSAFGGIQMRNQTIFGTYMAIQISCGIFFPPLARFISIIHRLILIIAIKLLERFRWNVIDIMTLFDID